MKALLGALLIGTFLLFTGVRVYKGIMFDRDCEGYLKRAADSNTPGLARQELDRAVAYAESHGLTSGFTSVLYTTPDEDVGFWYQNLKQSQAELAKINEATAPLERSNVLMKLRETLLDEGKTVSVPSGISIFPNNVAYAWWGWLSSLLAIFGCVLTFMWFDEY